MISWISQELGQPRQCPPWAWWGERGGRDYVSATPYLAFRAIKEVSVGLSHQIPTSSLLEPKQTNWPLDTIETHVPNRLGTLLGNLLLWGEESSKVQVPCAALGRSNPDLETAPPHPQTLGLN